MALHVTDLLATNAGDEHHLEANWWTCPDCGADVRVDYEQCWKCGGER